MRKLIIACCLLASSTFAAEQQLTATQFYKIGLKFNEEFLRGGQTAKYLVEEAARNFKIAADLGHAGGQLIFGICLKNARGVKQDLRKAMDYFELAAAKKIPLAKELYEECSKKYFEDQGIFAYVAVDPYA
jgi:TPR repeat protein